MMNYSEIMDDTINGNRMISYLEDHHDAILGGPDNDTSMVMIQ